ncbi:WD40 domain-containing protein [Ceratobasidium sp. AG-Ba]|nr:WD40 domain-containing protein [Ceratobasidium sp. AG-Ba]QRW13849.1 WD40 domain-containing protein [Ceratobasidium sp. AG-Ba]
MLMEREHLVGQISTTTGWVMSSNDPPTAKMHSLDREESPVAATLAPNTTPALSDSARLENLDRHAQAVLNDGTACRGTEITDPRKPFELNLDASRGTGITSIFSPNSSASVVRHHSTSLLSDSSTTNFARNIQWSVDGRALLVVCEDSTIEVLGVEQNMDITPSLAAKNPAPVLSTAWFPTASPSDPASYCFVSAVRDCPVRLVDASDGRLRASYRIIDHQERFIAPHCMGFNMYMNRLYCGFEDAIEIFDVHNPGVEGTRLHTVPTKKSRDGLRGIISALAFTPDWSGLYAVGSFSGGIAMYTEDTGVQIQGWLEGIDDGVSQIKFNPTQPHLVHVAFRRSSTIATWDIRNPVEPVGFFDRGTAETNQRLWFDVRSDGQWLAAGDEGGVLKIFDINKSSQDEYNGISINAHKGKPSYT